MLIIGILITVNSGAAIPQGTVIKEGVLTYPAGPYLTEDLLLLSLENYEDGNITQTLDNLSEIPCPENRDLFFANNNDNIISWSSAAENLQIYHPSNIFSIQYGYNTEILCPGLAFLCCPAPPFFNRITLSTPFNATFW